jgi:hypothetical protein
MSIRALARKYWKIRNQAAKCNDKYVSPTTYEVISIVLQNITTEEDRM